MRESALAMLGPRGRPFWLTAGAILLIFSVFRAILLAMRIGEFDAGMGQIARCLMIGVRYDLMPMGYLCLPVAIVLAASSERALASRLLRRIVSIYAAGVVMVVLIVEAVGTPFFLRYGQRLNWMAVYGLTPEIRDHIRAEYPAWWVLAVAIPLLGLAIYLVLMRLFWGRRPSVRRPEPGPAVRLMCGFLVVSTAVIACRGGLSSIPLRRDYAYYTGNQLVSQLTLNNFVTAVKAATNIVTDGRDDIRKHDLPSVEEAADVSTAMLIGPRDLGLGAGANPLWRRTESARPQEPLNVVLIVMEGMAGRPVGALGHWPSQTPNFDRLCEQGLFFDRMYAVGARTSRGLTATLCGFPDLAGPSILVREKAKGHFLTLPQMFRQRGYHTLFVYGGKPTFDNMGEFFSAGDDEFAPAPGGVDEIISQHDMGVEPDIWGVHDEYIFDKLHKRLQEFDGDRPFFATVLTVSNHEPYHVPRDRTPMLPGEEEPTRFLNAYRYADWALGRYFEEAREADYFRNTIFVLVADHGRAMDQKLVLDVPTYRVPCLFLAPGLEDPIAPQRISTVCSQTDLAPTLLSVLGGPFEHCFMGRNVLDVPPGEGFALLHEADRLGFVRGNHAVVQRPRGEPMYFHTDALTIAPASPDDLPPGKAQRMQREMVSLYRMALYLYRQQAYHRPPTSLAGLAEAARTRRLRLPIIP